MLVGLPNGKWLWHVQMMLRRHKKRRLTCTFGKCVASCIYMRKAEKKPANSKSLRIDAEHMRVFVAIAQSRTLTEAALSLRLPLFTVSRVLKRIESTSQLALVRRDGAGLELTGAGRDYFDACESVLEAHQRVADVVARQRREPEGTLKISTPIPFAVHVLSAILPDFQRLYPSLRVDLDLYCSDWYKLPEAGHDIVFKVRAPKDSRHHVKVFPPIRQGLFASPDYLKQRSEPTAPTQLYEHVCLGMSSDPALWSWNLTRKSEYVSIKPNCAIVAPDMEIMTQLAVRSAGIAVLPLWRAHIEVLAGKLWPILTDWAPEVVRFFALHGGRLRMASRESTFLDYLAGILGTAADPRCHGHNPDLFFGPAD